MVSTFVSAISGVVTTGVCATTGVPMTWWQALLIACVPSIVTMLCELIYKKLGIKISEKTKRNIQDTTIDLIDDGKINGSNKDKGVNKDEEN